MRNVTPAFPSLNEKNLTAIILSAGAGRIIRQLNSKSTLRIRGEPLVCCQIRTIRERFPAISDIIVATGFDAEGVYCVLPGNIRTVENENYSITNSTRTLSLALRACLSQNILIVYGDIYFDGEVLKKLSSKTSVVIDNRGGLDNNKVGVAINQNHVTNFSFGLSRKFGGISLVAQRDLEKLKYFVHNKDNSILCLFEIFNLMIDSGVVFHSVEHGGTLKEINQQKDCDL